MEVVGASDPVKTAVATLRKGGALTLVGNLAPQIDFPLQAVVSRQKRGTGSCASCGEYPQCIEMLASGAIQVEPLISAKAPLTDGADWFARLYARENGLMKVILQP
jgi:L-iditol 2-dehydrogenase